MKVPSDLTDLNALRLFLETSTLGGIFGSSGSTSSSSSPGTIKKFLSSAAISAIIKASVREFDKSFRGTIDTVNYNIDLLGDQVNTNKIQVMSTLATNYATVDTIARTYATNDQVGALYTLNVDANGHVAGYQAVATGDQSVFNIYAEKFAISSSSTFEGYSPFQIDTVNHKINMTSDVAIDGSLLVSGTIDASIVNVTNINASNIVSGTISADKIYSGVIYNTGGSASSYTMKINLDAGEIHIV